MVYANLDKVIERSYGTWLRAPQKNARVGMGSRWLRNSSNGEGQWSTKIKQDEAENTVHGGDRVKERFMEVGGIICEISGADKAINIMQRDKGNVVVTTPAHS